MINQQISQKQIDFIEESLLTYTLQPKMSESLLTYTLQPKTSEYQELNLKYSYSEMSNPSSDLDFCILTAARSSNEDQIKLNFVKMEKLFETISSNAVELQKKMFIHQDLILYLLYLHKWNEEKLFDVYYENYSVNYQKLSHQILNYETQIRTEQKASSCNVCCSEQKFLIESLFCKHSYCKDCWLNYIQQNLAQNKIFFSSCMESSCERHPMLLHFVKKISITLSEFYRKKICVNYAKLNKSVSYCPSDNCLLFCEKSVMAQKNFIECPCGFYYCFKCEKQPHEPAACEQVQKWEQVSNQQNNNQLWIKKYTRKCPVCKQPVEKYVGCNHIKCICGNQFCFNCTKPWDQLHKQLSDHCVNSKSFMQGEKPLENSSNRLEQLIDKIIYFSRCMNKDALQLKRTLELIVRQQNLVYLKQIFHQLKSRVFQVWANVKWSTVALYLRQKPFIQEQIEKDTLESINKLRQIVERMHKKIQNFSILSHLSYAESKQLLSLKQDLYKRKQVLAKTMEVWNQAWKSIVGEY